jgi:uncharacterized protein YggE
MIAMVATALMPAAFAQDKMKDTPKPPTLRVTGQAVVHAEPDMATFDVGVEIKDPSASKAMAEAGRISDRIVQALMDQKIPKEKLRTSSLSLNQVWEPIPDAVPDNRGNQNRLVYQASHILHVEVGRDRFDDLGEILDAAMKAGANSVNDISFIIKDDTDLRNEGLAQAVKNARSKAEIMAKAADMNLKGIRTLEESSGYIEPPRPMMMMAKASFAGGAPSPISPSDIERTYTVSVEYELAP